VCVYIYTDAAWSNSRFQVGVQSMPIHSSDRLSDDVLPLVMCAIPASKAQIAVLQEYRAICKNFKKIIDICMHNVKWRNAFAKHAADFRDDVLLHGPVMAPFVVNRGIERLLHIQDWATLLHGMREYNVDEPSQEYIIRRLVEVMTWNNLHPPLPVALSTTNRTNASATGVQGALAWAMRIHPNNIQIVRDAALALSLTSHEPHQIAGLTPYILRTLTSTMYNHLEDLEIQRNCIQALAGILENISENYYDVDDDGGNSVLVIDKSALFQRGEYTMPTLIINAMRRHMEDHELLCHAGEVFLNLTQMMNNLTDRTCMRDFVMHQAEVVLLAVMHRNSHGATPHASNVQESCIFALQELMQYDFASMQHVQSEMQCAIDAGFQYGGEFVDGMVHMFEIIMTLIGTDDVQKSEMQRFVARSGMVHIFLQKLRAGAPAHDHDAYFAYDMVTRICEGNADTTALMVAGDVLRTIDSMCNRAPKTADWQAGRNKLLAIFGSVGALQ